MKNNNQIQIYYYFFFVIEQKYDTSIADWEIISLFCPGMRPNGLWIILILKAKGGLIVYE